MKLIEKILVGTDFGPSSDNALAHAIALAQKFNSSIILAHIIPGTELTGLTDEMVQKTVQDEIEVRADRAREKGIQVKTKDSNAINLLINIRQESL